MALAIVATLALLLGAGAGLLLGGGTSADVSADGDLRTACGYLEEIDTPIENEDISLDDPLLWQLTAVGSLAVSAGYGGQEEALREAGEQLMSAVQRLDIDQMSEAMEEILAHC